MIALLKFFNIFIMTILKFGRQSLCVLFKQVWLFEATKLCLDGYPFLTFLTRFCSSSRFCSVPILLAPMK